LNTSQKGHWYKCDNVSCGLKIPLPDKIFIETHYNGVFEAECKCGNMNYFSWSDAGDKTNKLEVDKCFGIKGPRLKWVSYWEE
jgi:hypothetical protein